MRDRSRAISSMMVYLWCIKLNANISMLTITVLTCLLASLVHPRSMELLVLQDFCHEFMI